MKYTGTVYEQKEQRFKQWFDENSKEQGIEWADEMAAFDSFFEDYQNGIESCIECFETSKKNHDNCCIILQDV